MIPGWMQDGRKVQADTICLRGTPEWTFAVVQPFTEAISSGAERSLSDAAAFCSHSVPEKSGRQIWTICFLVNIFSTEHSGKRSVERLKIFLMIIIFLQINLVVDVLKNWNSIPRTSHLISVETDVNLTAPTWVKMTQLRTNQFVLSPCRQECCSSTLLRLWQCWSENWELYTGHLRIVEACSM